MARKMRWFQNQLSKANQTPVCRHTLDKDLELEELEVEWRTSLNMIIIMLKYFFYSKCIIMYQLPECACTHRCSLNTAHIWEQVKLTELETELLESIGNSEKLKRIYSELLELGLVLHKVAFPKPKSCRGKDVGRSMNSDMTRLMLRLQGSAFFMTARSAADLQRRQADLTIVDAEETDHPLLLEQMHVSPHISSQSYNFSVRSTRITLILSSDAPVLHTI